MWFGKLIFGDGWSEQEVIKTKENGEVGWFINGVEVEGDPRKINYGMPKSALQELKPSC